MAFRLALPHQTWDSFSCFNVSKSTTRRSAEGCRDSHKEPNLIITKGNEKLAQTRLNRSASPLEVGWDRARGPRTSNCPRQDTRLEVWVRAEGCEDKGGGFCRYAPAFDLSALLLTLAGNERKKKEGQALPAPLTAQFHGSA